MIPAVAGALVGGGLNLVADIFSQHNARDAFKSRYQDTVADMRKAGLNPALAYGQGGGNPQTVPIGDIGSSVASAMQASAQTHLINSQAKLLDRQADDIALTTQYKRARADFQQQGEDSRQGILGETLQRMRELNPEYYAKYRAQAAKASTDAERARLGLPSARAYSNYYNSWAGKSEPYIKAGQGVLNSAASAYQKFRAPNTPSGYEDNTISGKGWKKTTRNYQGHR